MRFRVLSLFVSFFVFLIACGNGEGAATKARSSAEGQMVQRLLKTKSCPSCDLAGADLRGAKLNEANLEGADLGRAQLSYADLSGANLKKANLKGAHLGGANLEYADLDGAQLAGTVFEGALFKSTKIRGRMVNRLIRADQATERETTVAPAPPVAQPSTAPDVRELSAGDEVVPPTATGAGASNVQVQPKPLKTIMPASSPPAPVVEESRTKANNSGQDAGAGNTGQEELVERMFDRKRCVGCDFTGVHLAGKDLEGFDLERASFRDADLRDADLSEANLKGAVFRNAQLPNADFRDADLYRADFTGADLTGAVFTGAKIDGADFSGAQGLNLEGATGKPRSR